MSDPRSTVVFLPTPDRPAGGELATRQDQTHKLEAVGRLAGGVAHDFNNLLMIIDGCASLLLELHPSADPSGKLALQIQRASRRASDVTRQLLVLSRRQLLALQTLDLNATVSGLTPGLVHLAGVEIVLTTRLSPQLASVKADPEQLAEVITQLVANARDAIAGRGQIAITTEEVRLDHGFARTNPRVTPGDYVLLSVTDTGAGMSPEVLDHLFEPFFTTKPVGKGKGLGLAMVYGVVGQLGGHVAVSSEPGHGSVFEVYLPQVAPSAPIEPPRYTRARRGGEVVLLVEDEAMVRALSCVALRSLGYLVIEAADGVEALRKSEDRTIDLLITDVVMPRMNGRELAERLTARRPETKVLFISGYTDDAILREGVARGETRYLQKPFTPASLGEAVRGALDE